MVSAVRSSMLLLYSVSIVLTALLFAPAGMSRADDTGLPPVSLTSTSGAPLQPGATYGIGMVVVAHFAGPVDDRSAAEQQLAVSTDPPVSGARHWVDGKTLNFWTQPGIYTVMDKSNPVVMDSSTYGLPINSHLGYKESINYAVRISSDGIYLHELDATVWAQGKTDTSHGCLNLNHDNAVWFYNFSVPGDVVEVRNTGGKPLQLWQNGDWSVPWDQWT